ncbi:SAM-dependent methyltransferase [Billgrantia saliphila]|uniref:SAM-dependent methyltransferase n=1 Tax=Billgrantia saliphila TaxID=1848458 RepID=UPI000CE355DF|nr:SAM-dependent methyltransferase [Halomonas saliphila]
MHSAIAKSEANPYPALGLRLDPRFVGVLIEYVRAKGGISFAEFMDRSLYGLDGEGGYYNSGVVSIGNARDDDFVTAPERSRYFGRTLAKALVDMHTAMGRPRRFDVVEMGAGNGTLARDIIETLQVEHIELHDALRYTIVERSRALIVRQQGILAERPRVRWLHAGADSLPLRRVRGVFLSNELPDAFPVHRAVIRRGELKEIYVTLDSHGNFSEEERSPSAALAAVLMDLNKVFPIAAQPEGERLTVNVRAMHWMRELGMALDEGYVLTFDYGEPGAIRKAPYTVFDWEQYPLNIGYQYPGAVDMTSHVDPIILAKIGSGEGLEPIATAKAPQGVYAQPAFLEAYGLRESLRREKDSIRRNRGLRLLGKDYSNFFALVQRKTRQLSGPDKRASRKDPLSRMPPVRHKESAHVYRLGDIPALNDISRRGKFPAGYYVHFMQLPNMDINLSSFRRGKVICSGCIGRDGRILWPDGLRVRAAHDTYIVITCLSAPEMKNHLDRGESVTCCGPCVQGCLLGETKQ